MSKTVLNYLGIGTNIKLRLAFVMLNWLACNAVVVVVVVVVVIVGVVIILCLRLLKLFKIAYGYCILFKM
jgi:hypothetical protein